METTIKTFKHELSKINGAKVKSHTMEFEQAMEVVKTELAKVLIEKADALDCLKGRAKDKEYLRDIKKIYRSFISDIFYENNIKVRGYLESGLKEKFIDEMMEESIGYSILSDAMRDPYVTDVFVISYDTIFVERKGKNIEYHKSFRSKQHYKDVLERFAAESGHEINLGDSKIVDFELYGDRCCATHPVVSQIDYSLTIRKHNEDSITRDQMIEGKVMTEEIADLVGILMIGESNMAVAGITGSGKTTFLRANVENYIVKKNKRVITCEDTPELFLDYDHVVSLLSSIDKDPMHSVPLLKLIYTAMRLKPRYIIIGEVRGEEALAVVESMETGHGTLFTIHGEDEWNVLNRMMNKYALKMPSLSSSTVERIICSSLDYIVIIHDIVNLGRRLTKIVEVDYDFENNKVIMKTICEHNTLSDTFTMLNKLSPDKVKKMVKRGADINILNKYAA